MSDYPMRTTSAVLAWVGVRSPVAAPITVEHGTALPFGVSPEAQRTGLPPRGAPV